MVLAKPGKDALVQNLGKLAHLGCLAFRDRVRPLVVGGIALLSEQVEFPNCRGIRPDGELKRMDHAIVMIGAISPVTGGRQRGRRQLKSRVVRNIELPIRSQIRRLTVFQIPIGDGEQVGDFLLAGLVLLDPSELAPIS